MAKTNNIVLDKSFDFAIRILNLYVNLKKTSAFYLNKLLRSRTNIGANVEEAIGAYSKKEFSAKMGIVQKEARETRYWLRLLDKSQLIQYNYSEYLREIEDLVNILTAIVKTCQEEGK